jgi:hypothetical protein
VSTFATSRVVGGGATPDLRLTGGAGAPGYVASAARLTKLRERRRVRRLMRDLYEGKWRRVLIDLQVSQHAWPKLQKHSGTISELLTKVNLVKLAWTKHADVLVGTTPSISVPDGFEQHRRMLGELDRACHLDALLHAVATKINIEAEAAVRADVVAGQAVLVLEDNDVCLPVGPDGPDNQPTVWERRWVVERPNPLNPKKPKLFLRVERHRAPEGRGIIEQEAYETESTDVLCDLASLRRVTLAAAIPADLPAGALLELVETGATRPLVTRFVQHYYDGDPQFGVQESDLDLVDTMTAGMTRLARTHDMHGRPKVRVTEDMVDKRTGQVDLTVDAVIDPDKLFEYIRAEAAFAEMLNWLNKTMGDLLTVLEMSPSLLGVRYNAGAAPDTFGKLRLESTNTLGRAKRSAVYFGPALERSLTTASEMDTVRPLRGYALGAVSVKMRPELPKDVVDLAEELAMLQREGLIDRRSAIARLHGEEVADQMMSAIESDKAREAAHQQAALFGAVPGGNPEGTE